MFGAEFFQTFTNCLSTISAAYMNAPVRYSAAKLGVFQVNSFEQVVGGPPCGRGGDPKYTSLTGSR